MSRRDYNKPPQLIEWALIVAVILILVVFVWGVTHG